MVLTDAFNLEERNGVSNMHVIAETVVICLLEELPIRKLLPDST